MAAIREWKNSFTPINRIPLDVLSLIPTHLPSLRDRLVSTFVCRLWRRTFIQRAELWSELSLPDDETFVKTLLERSKGSGLDITIENGDPVGAIVLLSPHTERMKHLNLRRCDWPGIQKFSRVNSGPLPLLQSLVIHLRTEPVPESLDRTPPSSLLLINAVNLRSLNIQSFSRLSPFLTHFIFPNLVSFNLIAMPSEKFQVSQLLDFLEASPALQIVHMFILADTSFESIPQKRLVLLPNVEKFILLTSHGGCCYEIAAHISCPSARRTSLTHKNAPDHSIPAAMFPIPVSWDKIVHQYTRSSVEEVALEIDNGRVTTCKLIFWSPDEIAVELCCRVVIRTRSQGIDGLGPLLVEVNKEVFTQATRAIQNYPQLKNIKRLRISQSRSFPHPANVLHIQNEVGRLFKTLGPLEGLMLELCDMRPYLDPFIEPPEPEDSGIRESVVFPPIQELVISHPLFLSDEQFTAAIVGLAKSQHARGIPFESVTIYAYNMSTDVEEELRPWVGNAEYSHEEPPITEKDENWVGEDDQDDW